MELAAGKRLGPYEVVGAIDAGGMGEVYRARDTRLDRCVAVKILPAHFSSNPELKSRFEREARTLSSVAHPHICHLYDVGSQSGTDYLVMERLEGETLAARVKKGPLATSEEVRIGTEITDALASAHRLGLVHRDLKPSNIMLTKMGAKLMDFGLAKPAVAGPAAAPQVAELSGDTLTAMQQSPGTPITIAGSIVGTIQYMSPEQLEGKEADARSDIFALGAVLYEMATGKRAFTGKSQLSVMSAILEKEPEPVSSAQPMASPALDRVVQGCLAKDPDERWQTAHDVKLQLQWIAEGGSQAGIPAPVSKRRRMSQSVAWAAAGVFFLAALGFAVAWMWRAPNPRPLIRVSILAPDANSFKPFDI